MATPKTKLNLDTTGDQWAIALPAAAPDPIATVIKIDVEGMPKLMN